MVSRVEFERIAVTEGNVRHLGSLVFDRRNVLGSRAYLDLRLESNYVAMARDCIASLYEHVVPGRISSDLSLDQYFCAVRELLDYCLEKDFKKDICFLDLDFEFLLGYRAHLSAKLSENKSDLRRRRYGCLTRLLQAASTINLASSDFVVPRNFSWTRDSDRTQPYSFDELLDLEGAARAHITELVGRLAHGRHLLKAGVDPRGRAARDPASGKIIPIPKAERRWNQLPNLLWYVVNVLDGRYLDRSQLLKGHSSFNNALMGVGGCAHRKQDVYFHLYPLSQDLIPFVILLAKSTGRNEHSILELNRDCLQEINGRHILWYEKRRGGQAGYRKVISDDGPFSPVQLIKLLLELTEPLIRFADESDRNKLLIGLTIHGHGKNPVKSLDPSYIKDQMNREGGWCQVRNLIADSGEPFMISLRRLRVSYLTARYRKTGQLGKVSRDAAHSLKSTSVSYVENEATRHLHEQAIERGILAARSVASSIVIPGGVEVVSKKLNISGEAAASLISGEHDVFFAVCRDFYNRPGGPRNTPCDLPWGCFSCSNAIISSHVLPRVLKFKMFMEEKRQKMLRQDWDTLYGAIYELLVKEVLPQFTAEAITFAARLAEDEILYVPLELQG